MSHIHYLFIAVGLGFLVWALGSLGRRFREEHEALDVIEKALSQADGLVPAEIVERIRTALGNVSQRHQRSAVITAWREYDERWCQLKDDADLLLRVSAYFNPDTLLDRVERRFSTDASTVVSFGVFLTFLGFVIGLSGIAKTDVEQMKNGIGLLLGGVQGAFSTSIIGIGGAAWWTWRHRTNMLRLEHRLRSVSARLAQLLDPDEEEVFRQRMERMFRSGLGELRTILADALEQALQPSMEQFQRQTALLEQQLDIERERSREIAERMLDSVAQGTADRIAQLAKIIENTRQVQEQLLEAVQAVIARHDQAAARWESLLDRMLGLAQHLDQLQGEVNRLMTTAGELGQRLEQYQQQAGQLVEAQAKWLPELRQTLHGHGQSLVQAGERFVQAGAAVDQRLHTLTEHWYKVQEAFAQVRTALDSALQGFSARIEEGLGKTYTHFDRTLAEAMQNVGGLVSQTKDLNQELADRVEEVGDALDRLARTLQQAPAATTVVPDA